jgi:hypothetical protein
MRFSNLNFAPGLTNMGIPTPTKATRNYAVARGTEARRGIRGADGDLAAVVYAKNNGGYGGRRGNTVFCVLQRINATPRYVLQFFESDGTQIGSTIVENGTSLNGLASTLASNANGTHFLLSVVNNTNQATADTGNGFANAIQMSGGA